MLTQFHTEATITFWPMAMGKKDRWATREECFKVLQEDARLVYSTNSVLFYKPIMQRSTRGIAKQETVSSYIKVLCCVMCFVYF